MIRPSASVPAVAVIFAGWRFVVDIIDSLRNGPLVGVSLDVFERDLARVHVGDQVEISSETWPGRVFRGQVGHIGASIDLDTLLDGV